MVYGQVPESWVRAMRPAEEARARAAVEAVVVLVVREGECTREEAARVTLGELMDRYGL